MVTVLVTGTSGGIGEQIALQLLEQSDTKVIGAARRAAPDSLSAKPNYTHVTGDLTDAKIIADLVHTVGPRLDGAVFNAGILDSVTRIANTDMTAFKKVFDVNLFSVVALTQALIPALRAAKGRAIYVSSGASTSGYEAWTAYGASKAALNLMVTTLAHEEPEITALSVAPGVVDTPMQTLIRGKEGEAEMKSSDMQKFLDLKRENKLVDPRDSGRLYANLALRAPHELSGRYLRYNDPLIAV